MAKMIQTMEKGVRRLTKIVSENQNTRKDIKETSATMRSLMSQLTTDEMYNLMRTGHQTITQPMVQETDVSCQTDVTKEADHVGEVEKSSIQTRDVSTQTGVYTVNEYQVKTVSKYEDFTKINGGEWPEDIYTVKWVEGFAPQAEKTQDLLIWDEGEK